MNVNITLNGVPKVTAWSFMQETMIHIISEKGVLTLVGDRKSLLAISDGIKDSIRQMEEQEAEDEARFLEEYKKASESELVQLHDELNKERKKAL